MAQTIEQWTESDVTRARERPLRWLSERHFFRDPVRPIYSDASLFFAPADGIIIYQSIVDPGEPLVEIKGVSYTLRQALRDPEYSHRSLVIGIFMTAYDVHINRIPYAGSLSFRELPAIASHNRPMLAVEEMLLGGRQHADGHVAGHADYLFTNQRMVNRVAVPALGLTYQLLQIADYDVSTILPFSQHQAQPVHQNQRFSQIRFGSQVDLIVPLTPAFDYEILLPNGLHVEAGIDPLIRLHPTATTRTEA